MEAYKKRHINVASIKMFKTGLFWTGFVTFILSLPSDGRPRNWHLRKLPSTSEFKSEPGLGGRLLKRSSSQEVQESFCPIYAPGVNLTSVEENNICGPEYSSCEADEDCASGYKCCYDGCVHICMESIKQDPYAIDWVEEPQSKTVSETYWLIDGASNESPPIECSTSNMNDSEPLYCPNGYECLIQSEENQEDGLPNRGVCTKKVIKNPYSIKDAHLKLRSSINEIQKCIHKEIEYGHGDYFYEGCNLCFCNKGIVTCQLSPCTEEDDHQQQELLLKSRPTLKLR